jgi:hypothetical protein
MFTRPVNKSRISAEWPINQTVSYLRKIFILMARGIRGAPYKSCVYQANVKTDGRPRAQVPVNEAGDEKAKPPFTFLPSRQEKHRGPDSRKISKQTSNPRPIEYNCDLNSRALPIRLSTGGYHHLRSPACGPQEQQQQQQQDGRRRESSPPVHGQPTQSGNAGTVGNQHPAATPGAGLPAQPPSANPSGPNSNNNTSGGSVTGRTAGGTASSNNGTGSGTGSSGSSSGVGGVVVVVGNNNNNNNNNSSSSSSSSRNNNNNNNVIANNNNNNNNNVNNNNNNNNNNSVHNNNNNSTSNAYIHLRNLNQLKSERKYLSSI